MIGPSLVLMLFEVLCNLVSVRIGVRSKTELVTLRVGDVMVYEVSIVCITTTPTCNVKCFCKCEGCQLSIYTTNCDTD